MFRFNIHHQGAYCCALLKLYRVSIKYFPDYKHLLQENYCTWNTNIFFQNVTQEVFFYNTLLQHVLLLLYGERLIDNQFLSTVFSNMSSVIIAKLSFILASNL